MSDNAFYKVVQLTAKGDEYQVFLETERLILRELTAKDFDELYEVLGDSDIMRHYPYVFDANRVHGWIEKNIERYRIFGFGLWAVELKETGELIGDCGISMQNINGTIKPEIGYHIKKSISGRVMRRRQLKSAVTGYLKTHPFA